MRVDGGCRGLKVTLARSVDMLDPRGTRGEWNHFSLTRRESNHSQVACSVYPPFYHLDTTLSFTSELQYNRRSSAVYSLPRNAVARMSRTDLSPVTLLQQEIQTLTSSMRRNQRWASTSTSSYQSSNSPLPPAFHPKNGKRSRESSIGSRRGRQSGEGVEEGDLMLGFIELRRTLAGVKGMSLIISGLIMVIGS